MAPTDLSSLRDQLGITLKLAIEDIQTIQAGPGPSWTQTQNSTPEIYERIRARKFTRGSHEPLASRTKMLARVRHFGRYAASHAVQPAEIRRELSHPPLQVGPCVLGT